MTKKVIINKLDEEREKKRKAHVEKLKKEYEAKLEAQKKWIDSLEYPYQLDQQQSSSEDYFANYWKENNNRLIDFE